ncbi:Lsm6p [Malassezia vespertilionis]|uniref:U6 snRNA-associated Sm-like protein LSm6 n=1 Tax=Malassezia vespertilionis TaxID=2020962 RepID=A0A2N1JDD3_9BASI|nr:Lsm6p [Malassezia vespertilionis]
MADQSVAIEPVTNAEPQVKAGSPNDFLKGVIGKPVAVRLNSGIDYRGVLTCLDGYMNIAMEDTIELVDGVRKNDYGDTFIRGNNVLYITALDA